MLFVWKCFGDGIANIYFDKYALKHTLYKIEDYMLKKTQDLLRAKKALEWSGPS